MFNNHFVLSVLQDSKILKEAGDRVEVPFDTEYTIRLRNKHRNPCAVDLYIDGELVNTTGHIIIFGNDYSDITGFLKSNGIGNKFVFTKTTNPKVRQENEPENGVIEARFYLQKEQIIVPTVVERPVWIFRDNYIYPQWPYPPFQLFCNDNIYTIGADFSQNNSSSCNTAGSTVAGDVFSYVEQSTMKFKLETEPSIIRCKLIGLSKEKSINIM
jgi:hypothetical protein